LEICNGDSSLAKPVFCRNGRKSLSAANRCRASAVRKSPPGKRRFGLPSVEVPSAFYLRLRRRIPALVPWGPFGEFGSWGLHPSGGRVAVGPMHLLRGRERSSYSRGGVTRPLPLDCVRPPDRVPGRGRPSSPASRERRRRGPRTWC